MFVDRETQGFEWCGWCRRCLCRLRGLNRSGGVDRGRERQRSRGRRWCRRESESEERDFVLNFWIMAMSLPQQIGALPGTPIVADSGTVFGDPKSTTVNASAMWRSPARSLRCVAARAGEIDRISPSLPLSPRMGLMRLDLSVACQALMEAVSAEEVVVVREYKEGGAKVKGKGGAGLRDDASG
ncbi:unnamed protein product [Camellia sinensis]